MLPRNMSKRNSTRKVNDDQHVSNIGGITQIIEQSMGHLSTNFDSEKIKKSFTSPTSSFGEIEFTGLNQNAKFVRLLNTTTEAAIQGILQTKWELTPPTLVISIFGRDFEKKRKLKMIIKKGLWKAAESAGCWIVTEGFNLGIMKLAGDAVRDYTDAYGGNKMIAIGVAPWNCVAKNEILENAIQQGTNPAIYQSEEEAAGSDDDDKKTISREKSLDTNHSYFLLTDSSTVESTASQDLQFRTRFEHAVSSWKPTNTGEVTDNEIRIPICGLVVGGDIYTLRQVCNSIIVNKCPIVACQGTSGSADVFALGLSVSLKFAIEESPDDPDVVPLDARLDLIVRECLQKMNPEIIDFVEDVRQLMHIFTELSFLISVFDMDEDWDLDGYIISSLLSSAGSEVAANQLNLEQLEITLTLNRADIAKEKIFLENKKWKKGDLNEYMFNALMSDRHEFVKLFLEQGFSLEDFLTIYTLEKLYTDQLKNMDSRISIFQQLWNNHKIHKNVKLKEVGKVIKVLVGDFYHPLYLSKDFQSQYFRPIKPSANAKSSLLPKSSYEDFIQPLDHSYENKGLEDESGHHKSSINTISGSHTTKTTNLAVNSKSKDGSRQSKDLSDKVSSKNVLIRRRSSLDLINLTVHSKVSDTTTTKSNKKDTYISSVDIIVNKKRTPKRSSKTLFRRASSLDFIKTDNIVTVDTKSTISSSSASKNNLIKKRDEKSNIQGNIDEIDESKLKEINLERPARELMIWSLLMGKLKMTELFWTIEKEPIAGALLSSILLSALANKTDDFTDKEDYMACAKRFEEQAEGVLNECYMEDEIRAQMLINKELQYYGHSSVILLAAEGASIKFMAHPCCQDFLTSTWYGALSSKTSMIRLLGGVLIGMTLPFLLPNIVKYKLTESHKDHDDVNNSPKSTDIDDVEKGKGNNNILGMPKFNPYSKFRQTKRSRSLLLNYFRKIRGFYFAPIIRFAYSALSYVMFLVLFSVYLMYRFTVTFTNEEIVIIFWVGTLLIDEIKQIFSSKLSGISLKTYFADGWNKLDSTAITLFVIGFGLRLKTYIDRSSELINLNAEYFIILTDSRFVVAQVLISFSLFFFYVRLIYFFSIHIALGPKLIMIRKMISNDLIPFMIILMVFTIGYGVTAISIGYPLALQFTDQWLTNSSIQLQQKDVGSTIMQFMISSYFAMFGEFGLDSLRATAQYCDLSQPNIVPTPLSRIIVPIFLAVYVLLTNILLFNLLIAMFTKTYEEIEASSLYYWNFQRYQMVSEFNYRSPLAPPFIIFWNFYESYYFFKWKLGNSSLGRMPLHNNPFCISLADDSKKKRELTKWEHMKAMDFLRNINEPTHTSRQNRAGDNRSMVFRGAGGAGGSGALSAATSNPLAVQTSDTKADISGIIEEMNHQLDKRFKDVDTRFVKLTDIESQITGVSNSVKNLENHIEVVRNNQNDLLTKIEAFPKCHCTEIVNSKKSEDESLEQVKKFEDAIRTAVLALKDEFQPMLADLMKMSSAKETPDQKINEVEVVEPELEFTVTDDIGDVNNDPFQVPDVEDPNTGRIIERIVNNHRMWRYIPFNFENYPGMRMKVPNNIVSWQIPYSDYNPYDTSEEELLFPNEYGHDGNDPELYKDHFNYFDQVNKIKRQSMLGQYAIDLQTNAPLNPTGRTGLKGRGLLPHWGPNHSITTLFTRWSRDDQGRTVEKNNKPLLQYIVLERTKRFGIPWFLVDHTPTCDINECTIKTTLSYLEQRIRALFSAKKSEYLLKKILAASCSQTFKGFLDDHLNADNAWVETVVINFHESDNFIFTSDLLRIFTEKNSPETVKWLDLTHSVNLRTSHDIILKNVAQKMNSFF